MTFTATRAFADQFESAARRAKSPRRVASLLTSEITMRLRAAGLETEQSPVSRRWAGAGGGPDGIRRDFVEDAESDAGYGVRERGRFRGRICKGEAGSRSRMRGRSRRWWIEAIAANPKQVEQFRGGKRTVAAFFVGQVMKASQGAGEPGGVE